MSESVISRFSVHFHCNDLGGRVWNPAIRWTEKYAVFVVLEDSDGATGLGECWCFDSKPDALIAYLKTEIAPLVINQSANQCQAVFEKLWSRATLTARHGLLASAWSGVDIALWDLQSRRAGLPLWRCIQQQLPDFEKISRLSPRLYGSAGLYGKNKSTDDLVSEMRSIEASGFDLVKMKIGALGIPHDVERVNAVLNGLQSNTELIVDGVYSYSAGDALNVFQRLPAQRIHAFQSPVPAPDITGMQTLCKAGVPVMGTEAEYRHELQHQLINSGAVKYLQVAPVAVGGITAVARLAGALKPPVQLSLEVSSTALAFSAAWHLAMAIGKVAHVEYHYVHQVFFDALQLTPQKCISGYPGVTESLGIGITISELDVQPGFHIAA